MISRRLSVVAGCAICATAGVAFGITSGGADSPSTPSSKTAATDVQSAASAFLDKVATSAGGPVRDATTVATDAGVVRYGITSASARDGAASRSFCVALALPQGGGSGGCQDLRDGQQSIDRPIASVTVLGEGKYAVSAVLPPKATDVQISAPGGSGAPLALRPVNDVVGVVLPVDQIGTLTYRVDGQPGKPADLASMAQDPGK